MTIKGQGLSDSSYTGSGNIREIMCEAKIKEGRDIQHIKSMSRCFIAEELCVRGYIGSKWHFTS